MSTPDDTRAPVFVEALMLALNDGALCLMVSIGHRTGLFDVMRDRPPATSAEIALAPGLNERYVREWLGAMVTVGRRRGRPGNSTITGCRPSTRRS